MFRSHLKLSYSTLCDVSPLFQLTADAHASQLKYKEHSATRCYFSVFTKLKTTTYDYSAAVRWLYMSAEAVPYIDEDRLAEGINEFDRLMTEHEALQSAGEAQDYDYDVADETDYTVAGAKPDVYTDDNYQHGNIELIQLPVIADDNEKRKQPIV